jgi:cell wall assembly regulator SMI1
MAEDDARDRLRAFLNSILGAPEPPPPMTELVARLDVWLSRNRPDFYANLLPGLTDAEWAAFEARLGVPMPDAFRVLYQWRNGQPDDHSVSFHGNRTWTPAEHIVSTKELFDRMIGYDFPPDWWNRAWVPFLHNGAGSHLCVDTVGTDGGPAGQLVEFWNRDPDRPIVSPSLEHWLKDFVTSLERDRWEYTKYGFECIERREQPES